MAQSTFSRYVGALATSAATLCHAQDHVATLVADHELEMIDDGQSVRITILAWIDSDFADLFASVNFDVVVETSEPVRFEPLVDGHDARRLVYVPPATYENVVLGQLHFPPIGAFGDETNPLPICELEFFTHDLTPRELVVEVPSIFRYNVYEDSSTVDVTVLEPDQYPDRIVWSFPIGIACRADLDADGSLTLFDFLAFQNAFSAGDPIADFDGDGDLTLFDFLAFQNEFDAGCE